MPLLLAAMMLLLPLIACGFEGQVYQGKVVHVTDGNTLTLQVGQQSIRVDLIGVYAPALEQQQGMQAKKMLGNLVFGKTVKVIEFEQKSPGAIRGSVYLDDQDVSIILRRQGIH